MTSVVGWGVMLVVFMIALAFLHQEVAMPPSGSAGHVAGSGTS